MWKSYVSDIAKKRKHLNISQRVLAKECNVPQSTIGRIESGKVTPSWQTLEKITDALDMEIVIFNKPSVLQNRWNGVEFLCFWKDELVTYVKVDGNKAHIQKIINHPVKQIFKDEEIDLYRLTLLLETRCWQRERKNIDDYLNKLSLKYYDPLEIVKRTHGVSYNDFLWFKFNGENLTWKDVAPKRFRNV